MTTKTFPALALKRCARTIRQNIADANEADGRQGAAWLAHHYRARIQSLKTKTVTDLARELIEHESLARWGDVSATAWAYRAHGDAWEAGLLKACGERAKARREVREARALVRGEA